MWCGTDHYVRMAFRNRAGQNCTTKYLDNYGDDFMDGSSAVYGLEFMDSCSWEFTAHDQLLFQFQMVIPTGLLEFDDMKVCQVQVIFGENTDNEYIWGWSEEENPDQAKPELWVPQQLIGPWQPRNRRKEAAKRNRDMGLSETRNMTKTSGCETKGCYTRPTSGADVALWLGRNSIPGHIFDLFGLTPR